MHENMRRDIIEMEAELAALDQRIAAAREALANRVAEAARHAERVAAADVGRATTDIDALEAERAARAEDLAHARAVLRSAGRRDAILRAKFTAKRAQEAVRRALEADRELQREFASAFHGFWQRHQRNARAASEAVAEAREAQARFVEYGGNDVPFVTMPPGLRQTRINWTQEAINGEKN